MNETSTPVPIFWTGGVDSTFRVLDLVIRHKSDVQPIYIKIGDRKSQSLELAAMDRIRAALGQSFPEQVKLLRPTIVLEESQLQISEESLRLFELTRKEFPVVWSQNEWLTAAQDALGYELIEIAHQQQDPAAYVTYLRDRVVPYEHPNGVQTFVLKDYDPQNDLEAGMEVFRRFSFPIIRTSTADFDRIADEFEFSHLLAQSWTCRFPIMGEQCGMCGVCRLAIENGKAGYFSKGALLRYRYAKILNPIHIIVSHPRRALHKALSYLPFR